MKRFYILELNGIKVGESTAANICLNAKLFEAMGYYARVVVVFRGGKHDPVLHSPYVLKEYNPPPCPTKKGAACTWRKTPLSDKPRSTALRIESVSESDRCGFLLKIGNYTGNHFYDFDCCIRS